MRWISAICLTLIGLTLPAQADDLFDLFGEKTPFQQVESDQVITSAALFSTETPNVALVQLTISLSDGWNTYSQSPGFEKPTKITLNVPEGWEPIDSSFESNPAPKSGFDNVFKKTVEKYVGDVTFSRRYSVPEGTDLTQTTIDGQIDLLICDDANCHPKKLTLTAAHSTEAPQEMLAADSEESVSEAPGPFQLAYSIVPTRGTAANAKEDPIRLQFELVPAEVRPGEEVTLIVTMDLDSGWKTYGLEAADETQFEKPTVINVNPAHLEPLTDWIATPDAKVVTSEIGGEVHRSNAHEQRVSWSRKFRVISEEFGVEGTISYQICETVCLPPSRVAFSLGSPQKTEHVATAVPIQQSFAELVSAPKSMLKSDLLTGEEDPLFQPLVANQDTTLVQALFGAFIAGLLMNIMPCVLPVLAIKILSLVQQAGESRLRVVGLNLSYTAGVLAVFFVFAILSWGLGQSLGAVFQDTTFMTVMACVVFTMGLSLFGVFELPVPGIIPSAGDHQEGYFGAFNTGIVATILGSPCIAPLVAPFFAWTLAQPPLTVFSVFGMMGIGMASPYLMTSLFPSLVNWLPRPGMWMVRFKQFTGFVMMGTVIFILFSINMAWRIPVLILLLSLAMFVWMWATFVVPSPNARLKFRQFLIAFVTAAPVFVFGIWLMVFKFAPIENSGGMMMAEVDDGSPHKMPWRAFSEKEMRENRLAGRGMLIDFTANWCVNCKVNEEVALNTTDAVAFVREHDFVPMMADFTSESPEISKWLNHFGQDSVPLTIIIPPGKGSQPIALRGLFSRNTLMQSLNEAIAGEPIITEEAASQTVSVEPEDQQVGMTQ